MYILERWDTLTAKYLYRSAVGNLGFILLIFRYLVVEVAQWSIPRGARLVGVGVTHVICDCKVSDRFSFSPSVCTSRSLGVMGVLVVVVAVGVGVVVVGVGVVVVGTFDARP